MTATGVPVDFPLAVPRRKLLSELVYERLVAEIIDGRRAPGHQLRLDVIARTWRVSRTPVRQALLRLADLRFVTIIPNAGTHVADWTMRDMAERVDVLARLVTEESLHRLSVDGPITPGSTSGCELTGYLDLVGALIEQEFGRLGRQLVRDHAAPLQLLVAAATPATVAAVHRHGLDLERGRDGRRKLLTHANEAITRGDSPTAYAALSDLSIAFRNSLSAPSTTPV